MNEHGRLASLSARLIFETASEQYAFDMGYDAAVKGADTTNCHFTLFASKTLMEAWTAGNRAGKVDHALR